MVDGQISEYLGRVFVHMIPICMSMQLADRQTGEGQRSQQQQGAANAHRAEKPLLCTAAEGMERHLDSMP